MNSFIIFQQLLVLFGLMLLGFYASRRGWMTESFCRTLSALVVNIFNPLIVISSAVGKSSASAGSLLGQNLILCLILFTVAPLLSFPLIRLMGIPAERKGMYQNLLIFCNFGFMGIPLISGLYGTEYVIFVSFYMMFMNGMFYSVGMVLITGTFSLKKMINAGSMSCVVGLVIFLLGLQVPAPVSSFLSYAGNTCIPLSMMIVGANLARSDFKAMLSNKRFYLFTFVKMLVLPIVLVLLVRKLPFDSTLLGIYMVMAAMPCASIPALTVQERCSAEMGLEASQITTLTTLACLVTVPIVALFL